MDLNISIGAAGLAGALSFLSPCVLPLVPSYLVFISGTSLEDLRGPEAKLNTTYVLLAALMFVLGFTTVFVALGATASYFGQAVRARSSSGIMSPFSFESRRAARSINAGIGYPPDEGTKFSFVGE